MVISGYVLTLSSIIFFFIAAQNLTGGESAAAAAAAAGAATPLTYPPTIPYPGIGTKTFDVQECKECFDCIYHFQDLLRGDV